MTCIEQADDSESSAAVNRDGAALTTFYQCAPCDFDLCLGKACVLDEVDVRKTISASSRLWHTFLYVVCKCLTLDITLATS
jgi:hypothetical protein